MFVGRIDIWLDLELIQTVTAFFTANVKPPLLDPANAPAPISNTKSSSRCHADSELRPNSVAGASLGHNASQISRMIRRTFNYL